MRMGPLCKKWVVAVFFSSGGSAARPHDDRDFFVFRGSSERKLPRNGFTNDLIWKGHLRPLRLGCCLPAKMGSDAASALLPACLPACVCVAACLPLRLHQPFTPRTGAAPLERLIVH